MSGVRIFDFMMFSKFLKQSRLDRPVAMVVLSRITVVGLLNLHMT